MASRVVTRTRKARGSATSGMIHVRPAQPRFLHDVLGVGDAAQDAVGHRDQQAPVLLEDAGGVLGTPTRITVVHLHHPVSDGRNRAPCTLKTLRNRYA